MTEGGSPPTSTLQAYAQQRGLTYEAQGDLPGLTPLLTQGDKRNATDVIDGMLADGLEGTFAHYTYVITNDDGPDAHFDFFAVVTAAPETIGFAPRVTCHAKGGLSLGSVSVSMNALSGLLGEEKEFRLPDRAVRLESPAFHDRYVLKVDHDMGENWVRQLFSPAFITWLTESADKGLSFELIEGALCVFVKGKPGSGQDVERFCTQAAQVAGRLRGEALEESGMQDAGRAAMPDRPQESFDARVDREVEKVPWPGPPPDASVAIKAYRRIAMHDPKPWLSGISTGLVTFVAGSFFAYGGEFDGFLILLASPLVGYGTFSTMVGNRATVFGKVAFARQYALSRGMSEEEPRLFQARNMRLDLPGVVETALRGPIPGADLDGALVLVKASGSKGASFNVLVAELGEEPTDGSVDGAELEGGLKAASFGRTVAVYAASSGEKTRSAAELDEFAKRAGEAIRRLERPAGRDAQ